jgi:hypothetical protein
MSMERIVIEVNDVIARKWKYVQQQNKQKVTKVFEKSVAQEFKNQDNHWLMLEEIRKQAEEKGFTDEILNEILSNE